jgi:hypothetical protein
MASTTPFLDVCNLTNIEALKKLAVQVLVWPGWSRIGAGDETLYDVRRSSFSQSCRASRQCIKHVVVFGLEKQLLPITRGSYKLSYRILVSRAARSIMVISKEARDMVRYKRRFSPLGPSLCPLGLESNSIAFLFSSPFVPKNGTSRHVRSTHYAILPAWLGPRFERQGGSCALQRGAITSTVKTRIRK